MLKWLSRSFLFTAGILIGAQISVRILARLSPRATPARLAPLMESPLRRVYRDPARAVDFAGIHHNATVVDAGCGTGFFAIEAARRAGPGCVVYAIDIQPGMINALSKRIRSTQVPNIKPTLAPLQRVPLASNSVDTVLLISVLPVLQSRRQALAEISRVLKPGGVLVIGEEMPGPEYVRPATTRLWAERAGFRLVDRNGNAFAYLLKFVKPVNPLIVATSESRGDA